MSAWLPRSAVAAVGLAITGLLAGCGSYTPIRTHFNKGYYLYSSKNYSAAEQEYRAALEDEPQDFRARFNLAVTLEKLGKRAEARREYEEILKVKPDDLRASVNLAAMDIEDRHEQEGRERLQRMIEQHDRLALPRIALATHEFRAGHLDAAEKLVTEGLEREPADLEGNFILGEIYTARARAAAADDERGKAIVRARQAFDLALKSDAEDLASLLALGRLERFAKEPDDARSAYRRAVMIDRHNLEAHVALAQLGEELGDLESATYHLTEATMCDGGEKLRDSPAHLRQMQSLYERLSEQQRVRLAEIEHQTKP